MASFRKAKRGPKHRPSRKLRQARRMQLPPDERDVEHMLAVTIRPSDLRLPGDAR